MYSKLLNNLNVACLPLSKGGEFRDGNVPAGYEQLRVLLEALALLPAGVEKVRLRSDTAGYQHELLKYCAKGENKRFGRIEFAIGCDVTPEFKKAVLETEEKDWQPIYKEFDTPWAPRTSPMPTASWSY